VVRLASGTGRGHWTDIIPLMDSNLWRLILHPPRDGARNMAIDEALLEETAAGRSLPTLRLYAWEPPTLSLGFAQPAADVDRDALRRLGWGLVRRPTGGRAILHTDELTYSITAPETDPLMQGGVLESYRRLSLGLLAGLRLLGVEVQADEGARGRAVRNPVCFEIPSQYEISAGGKKLIGSAQARRLGGVLQHGAFPLGGDPAGAGPPPRRHARRAARPRGFLAGSGRCGRSRICRYVRDRIPARGTHRARRNARRRAGAREIWGR
jgi:lipoate-protein ligase A